MSYRITVQPSGHQFNVLPDETILEAALREGVGLAYGCRNGMCGSCKGIVAAGELDYGDYKESALTPEEKAAGKALFCRAKPLSDLTLQAKEVGGAKDVIVKTLPCRVESLEKRADDVMIVKIKLPATERLQFLAGQYIEFLLKDGKTRSYSLATPPHDDALLELHIRHMPGGLFSDQVFSTMKVRDILRLKGPLGSFFIREDSDKPMIFVAGGTGFAPIKGMLEHAFATHMDREMVLYWGFARARICIWPSCPCNGNASIRISRLSLCSRIPHRTIHGRDGPATFMKRSWLILRIYRATRCMPAARR